MAVSNLSPYQSYMSGKFPGKTTAAIDYGQEAENFFKTKPEGLDPASEILERRGGYYKWRDPQGYIHEATIQADGRSPQAGQWTVTTNRPDVLPQSGAGEQDLARSLTQGLQGLNTAYLDNATALARGERPAAYDTGADAYNARLDQSIAALQSPAMLGRLSESDLANLATIDASEKAMLADQQRRAGSDLIASLYGRGVQQSSIANQAAANFSRENQFANLAQAAQTAQRQLDIQKYLSDLGLQSNQAAVNAILGGQQSAISGFNARNAAAQAQSGQAADLFTTLTGQALQRDLTQAQIDQMRRDLAEKAREFDVNSEFANTQADIAVKQANKSVLGGIASGALSAGLGALAGPAGTAIGNRISTAIR
jgi:hypothetical protein